MSTHTTTRQATDPCRPSTMRAQPLCHAVSALALTNGSLHQTGITAGPELSGLAASWLAANPGLSELE